MASLKSEILVKREVRPCIVAGKTKALFHGFTEKRKIVPPSLTIGGHNGGVISTPAAIVEFEDGSVELWYAPDIKFCDSKGLFEEYAFDESEEE